MGLFSKLTWSNSKRFNYLFVSLVLFIVLPPFLVDLFFLKYAVILLLINVLGICTIIISVKSPVERYDFVLFIVLILASVLDDTQSIGLEIFRSIFIFLFFTLTIRRLVIYILKVDKVTESVIIGAVSAYLLLGLTGAVLTNLVGIIYPGSFKAPSDFHNFYNMVYYSFVTMSTLGYGDIVPQTPQAKSVAMTISVFGQLYLAVLMAMLVGKFLSYKNNERSDEDI